MSTATIKPLNLRNDPEIAALDRRRGHRIQPPIADTRRIPNLRETEPVPLDEKIVHLHYFVGGCDWYIAELDPTTFEAFGYANLGDPRCAEWGTIDIAELALLRVPCKLGSSVFRAPVERDLWWKPVPFKEIKR